ncbi:MAG: glucoamylase family protein [Candidatus Omnitrophica bacterium]|nr:glucoamylase family protein [Candidatus Omnitrophota bacterium]MDD5670323.1 glucoamylase family protein [Candidatus Omnitrophota bacterium]
MNQRFQGVILVLLILLTISLLPVHAFSSDDTQTQEEIDFGNVFRTVSKSKPLQTSPNFIVIDDFNTGKITNARGALWQTKAPAAGALDLSLEREDARNPERGYAMSARFNLSKKETATLQSVLNRVDVSHAEYLVFMCRLALEGTPNEKDPPVRLRIALTDWRYETAIYDFTDRCKENDSNWKEIILPMTVFKGLDLDQVFSVQFTLVAKNANVKGVLHIDELAFFGFNDVAFDSNMDNLTGFPKKVFDSERRKELRKKHGNKKFLLEIARDTWKFFENARDKRTQLVIDHIRVGDAPLAADYTSPTNIAMDLLATVSAMDLGFIKLEDASARTKLLLDSLSQLRRYQGFFYNFFDTKKREITRDYISTVDNGWLAVALVVIRQAFPGEIGKAASAILDGLNFEEFLDPGNNQLVVGFDVPRTDFGKYHYGQLVTEARATSFYAIGKGNIAQDHWWYLYRTLPAAWKWQNQQPVGKTITRDGVEYFQGYYTYRNKKFVPSWGGSLFEFLMPTLVMNEKKLSPKGLGLNNRIATELQRDYALKEKKYPVWGISPCATASGRKWKYEILGVKALGSKGYSDRGIITPHVSFLALDSLPKAAIANIRRLLDYEIYGEYGFYDSVNVRNGVVNPQYLALDQGMIIVAICNYLKDGSIQKRFHADTVGQKGEDLLKERFF